MRRSNPVALWSSLYLARGTSNDPKISEKHPVIKKIENLTRLLNFEGIEQKNSDELNQNLSLSGTAEPKMKNEKSFDGHKNSVEICSPFLKC